MGLLTKKRPTDVLRKAIKVTSRLRGLAVTGKQGDGVNDPQSSIDQLCFADEDTKDMDAMLKQGYLGSRSASAPRAGTRPAPDFEVASVSAAMAAIFLP